MRAVLIAGGRMSDYAYIRQFISPEDYIIAIDSGYHHAVALGLRPHVLLGDFDSITTALPEGIELHRVPTEKDFTDLDLAVAWARERALGEFLLLGTIGSRMDHTLSGIFLLSGLLEAGERAEVLDEHNRIWLTDREIEVAGAPGDLLSLIPLTPCAGVTTHNLAYPLQSAALSPGHGLGVSNVILESPAKVELTSGKLLVMLCRD